MCDHINGKNILIERRLIKVVFYLEGTCTFNHEFTSNFINSTLNLYQKSFMFDARTAYGQICCTSTRSQ